MAEIGEALGFIAQTKGKGDKGCWYCDSKKDAKGDGKADCDDTTKKGETVDSDTENCSTKLAKDLEAHGDPMPTWTITTPDDVRYHVSATKVRNRVTTPGVSDHVITPGAHHCIPGGACLAESPIKELIDNDSLPYNVNSYRNGVWLPGNYAIRPWNDKKEKRKKGKKGKVIEYGRTNGFKNTYACLAMTKAGRQFHDAHSKYNGNVTDSLKALNAKVKSGKFKKNCPICDKKLEEDNVPYGLVERLHFISNLYRTVLTGVLNEECTKKAVTAGIYTSSRVKKMHAKK